MLMLSTTTLVRPTCPTSVPLCFPTPDQQIRHRTFLSRHVSVLVKCPAPSQRLQPPAHSGSERRVARYGSKERRRFQSIAFHFARGPGRPAPDAQKPRGRPHPDVDG